MNLRTHFQIAQFLEWLTVASIAGAAPPAPKIRLQAPIYIDHRQFASIVRECDSVHKFARRAVLKILCDTPDGLVLWWVPGKGAELMSLPFWLSKSGLVLDSSAIKTAYSLNEIIWQRRLPEYKTVWLTDQQIDCLSKMESDFGKKTNTHSIGVSILRRTDQGIVLKLKAEEGRRIAGQITCITDQGRAEAPDLSLPPSHLTWSEKLRINNR